MIVGDTTYNTIEEILKGNRFEQIREAHRTGNIEDLPCFECDQLNSYENDNPLLWSNKDPEKKLNRTSVTKFDLENEDLLG